MTTPEPGHIGFILPVGGGSGGANSVVQEADELRRLGIDARIFVNAANTARFRAFYEDEDLAIDEMLIPYADLKDLERLCEAQRMTHLVATINTSATQVMKSDPLMSERYRRFYYVQDYEPWFYDIDRPEYAACLATYDDQAFTLFAKTHWLRGILRDKHGVDCRKIIPSIDHALFHPRGNFGRKGRQAIAIVAMVRVSTPRRAPRRTLRVLSRLSSQLKDRVQISVFGSTSEELDHAGMVLPSAFRNFGRLDRRSVARLIRGADLFLDLSDYQAFGRGAAEAMASGCIPLSTNFGGPPEFIVHGRNGYLVDVTDENSVSELLLEICTGDFEVNDSMKLESVLTSTQFSRRAAATSIMNVISKF